MRRRNPSNGSGFSDTGSMERPKIGGGVMAGSGLATGTVSSIGSSSSSSASATNTSTCSSGTADKRKKLEERIESKESRIDARQVIDDLIKSANLENDVSAGEGKTRSTFLACRDRFTFFHLIDPSSFCLIIIPSVWITAERHHQKRTIQPVGSRQRQSLQRLVIDFHPATAQKVSEMHPR